ncbi:hypothetical protein ZIOFF_018602 [Zingiber officinale]|uniref:Uncharacterized protein n=1 Tax=Zingiber officinale TaxID=94328 RepID=A0A8J5HWU0_ZINOF|nr:hypothetical protein ZIOFF_018602 [Zingiber officinale]
MLDLGSQFSLASLQVYYYYPFSALSDPVKLYNDLRWNISRPQGFEAVMRVRCSWGLEVQEYSGKFCKSVPSDIDLPGEYYLSNLLLKFATGSELLRQSGGVGSMAMGGATSMESGNGELVEAQPPLLSFPTHYLCPKRLHRELPNCTDVVQSITGRALDPFDPCRHQPSPRSVRLASSPLCADSRRCRSSTRAADVEVPSFSSPVSLTVVTSLLLPRALNLISVHEQGVVPSRPLFVLLRSGVLGESPPDHLGSLLPFLCTRLASAELEYLTVGRVLDFFGDVIFRRRHNIGESYLPSLFGVVDQLAVLKFAAGSELLRQSGGVGSMAMGGATSMESGNGELNTTTKENETLLAIITAYVQGEDIFEVYLKELKGVVSAIASLQGHLLVSSGPKTSLHKWTGTELNVITFYDAPLYVME